MPGFTQTLQLLVYNLFLRPLFIHRSLDLRLYLLLPILSHGEENNEHHKEDRGEENRQRTGEYIYEKTVAVDACKAIRENRGVPINHTGDYTVAEWCRLWFETYSKPNIRYNTAKGYEGIIEHHIIPAIGVVKLRQLSSIHIQRMYNETNENGRMQRGSKQNGKALSNTFVRRVHAVLQAALKQAVKERLIPYNPCENCRIPPKDKKEMTILPPEKIGRYLQEAEKYGVLPMFYLELSSGLRRGELLALQWSDLNVKERILTVNKQVTRMEGKLDVTEPKRKTPSAR